MTKKPEAQKSKFPYRDPALDVDRRVSDLLSRMTLEEKVRQMSMVAGFKDLLRNDRVSVAALRRHYGAMSPGWVSRRS